MTEREETERSVQMSRTTSLMDEYADKKFIRKKDRRKNPGRTAGRNAVLYLGLGALLLAGIPVQAAQETYRTLFLLDQLRWCGKPDQAAAVRRLADASKDGAVKAFAALVARELAAAER